MTRFYAIAPGIIKSRKIFIALAIIAGLTLGLTESPSIKAQQTTDAQQVRAANQAFYDAYSGRNMVLMEKIWAKKPYSSAVRPGGRTILTGWGAIEENFSRLFSRFTQLTVRMEDATVRVGPQTAWVVGEEKFRGLQRKVDSEVTITVLVTNVFEKQDGRWLMVHHHGTTAPRY